MRKSTHYLQLKPCVLLFYGYYTPHREGRYTVPFILHILRTITLIKQFCKGITMKKTILAVAISIVSLGAVAAPHYDYREALTPEEQVAALNKMAEISGAEVEFIQQGGKLYKTTPNGVVEVTDAEVTNAKQRVLEEAQTRGITPVLPITPAPIHPIHPIEDIVIDPIEEGDPRNDFEGKLPSHVDNDTLAQAANKMLDNVGSGTAEFTKTKDGSTLLTFVDPTSGQSRTINMSELDAEQLDIVRSEAREQIHASLPGVNPPADGDLPPILEDGTPIVDPIKGEKPVPSEGQKIVEGLKKAADGIRDAEKDWGENSTGAIAEYSQAVQAQTQSQIDELYALGNQNATDINTLFNEVDRLDSKIDGVAAMSQASLAARPYLSTNQTSSVGVGIGGAGSEAAFALGYAHRMTENWTANANVAVNTGDSAEASYGAGVSYAW